MATFHKGYKDIKVKLIHWPGNDFAKKVYEFGRLSNDIPKELRKTYNKNSEDCIKIIDKIIEGTTLPKFAMQGMRIGFEIQGISRICLAQLTRDSAIFASQGGGVFPLTMDFNIPLSLYNKKDIMEKVKKAQDLLEEAYIMACEQEVPALEARYIGLHSQTISLTASYTPADFVRSCYSRTSSNFCDECNLVYRLMYRELMKEMHRVKDSNSFKLYWWLFNEAKCINDNVYTRESLFNSDFVPKYDDGTIYKPTDAAINDWRKSCWKEELERIYNDGSAWLTFKETQLIEEWMAWDAVGKELPTTYDSNGKRAAKNLIKTRDYYKRLRNGK